VRGGKLYASNRLAWDGRTRGSPRWRLICAGIAALAIGFTVGLQVLQPAAVSVSQAGQAKTFAARWDDRGLQVPDDRRRRLASLDTTGLLESATADRQSEWTRSTGRGDFAATDPAVDSDEDSDAVPFDQRFATLFGWPTRGSIVETQERADSVPLPSPNPAGRAAPRHPATQSAPAPVQVASLSPAPASKKPVRTASLEESIPSPDEDARTAIYDISAQRVYLPDGRRLEAHSGLGDRLDDPRYVSEKGRGATPPNVYDLSLREELFHGVRALRLTPVGGANMFGREGLLVHTYMLGPNGQSNGCVSVDNYQAFLNAYLNGEIDRLVVVEHLASPPGSKFAWGWIPQIPQSIKALFGRS